MEFTLLISEAMVKLEGRVPWSLRPGAWKLDWLPPSVMGMFKMDVKSDSVSRSRPVRACV